VHRSPLGYRAFEQPETRPAKRRRASVAKVLRANDLKPHLARTFKVSKDPNFAAKVRDVVGLYLNPPQNAVVL
jgi:hypothetical protein